MPKRFDTNPLDPDFPKKARETAPTEPVSDYTAPTPEFTAPQRTPYSTAEFPTAPGSITEEETRRFQEADFQAYAFHGGAPPAVYQPRPLADSRALSDRKVTKTGIPEKWLIGLPYIPFSIGLVAGLILLFILPKEESKIRFHAAQGLAAHVGILIVLAFLSMISNVTDLADVGSVIFKLVTTIMLIVFAYKAWKGKPILIETVESLTNWLEEKIGPLKGA